MKRFVLVLVALGAMGMFAACKKDKKKDEGATGEAGKTTDTAGTDTAAGTQPTDQPATGDTAAQPTDTAAAGGAAAGAAAPAGDQTTGIAECDAYIKRLMSCDKYPQQGKDALKQSMDAWKQAAGAGGDAAKAAADACKKADEAASASLKQMGC
jgi:hypothetical protein